MRRAFLTLCLVLLALPAPAGSAPLGLTPAMPLGVDTASGRVAFLARVNPALAGQDVQHLAVFKDGAYARKALLQAEISPRGLHEALSLLGFRPGDNMTMANWGSERVQGQTLNVEILPDGADRPIPLAEFLRDQGGRGLDMRFGGNLQAATGAAAPGADASGCLICLFSCPMGVVSNHLTLYKETGWWGAVKYRAQWPGAVPDRVAVIVSRR